MTPLFRLTPEMNSFREYGPTISIPDGKIGEATILNWIENEAKNGFTVHLSSGGILSLIFTPEAQRAHRRKSREDWPEPRRAALLQVIGNWGNATGKAFRHNLEWHAKQLELPYSEIRAGCFLNPGRTPPPLRTEYEKAQNRRRDTFNASRISRSSHA